MRKGPGSGEAEEGEKERERGGIREEKGHD